MPVPDLPIVDAHVHVGLLGDRWPQWGRLSPWYQKQVVYRIFLLYSRIPEDRVCDRTLREATIDVIGHSMIDKVVCLALDPVYDGQGRRCEDRSHVWVDNDYVLALRDELPGALIVHEFQQALVGAPPRSAGSSTSRALGASNRMIAAMCATSQSHSRESAC